jgi:hypothetical protein
MTASPVQAAELDLADGLALALPVRRMPVALLGLGRPEAAEKDASAAIKRRSHGRLGQSPLNLTDEGQQRGMKSRSKHEP